MAKFMFDWYEPTDEFVCGHCGLPLRFQGKDGPNGLLVWRQGLAAPVDQKGIDAASRMDEEQRATYRLPKSFKLTGICEQYHMTEATGRCHGEVWSETEVAPEPSTPNLGPPPDEGGVEVLSDDELAAVVRLVQALVDHDDAVLQAADAYRDGRDPYEFTRNWRLWDHVDLVMPPGEPRTWQMTVYRQDRWDLHTAIDIDMFTVQEGGRSDLTLSLFLDPGSPVAIFHNLHVM